MNNRSYIRNISSCCCSSLHLSGYITNLHNDQLPVGLIAQLVEHCTGIAEVMGSNSVQAFLLATAKKHLDEQMAFNSKPTIASRRKIFKRYTRESKTIMRYTFTPPYHVLMSRIWPVNTLFSA